MANPGMVMKLPCLINETVVIGKSVMAFIRVVGNFCRKTERTG